VGKFLDLGIADDDRKKKKKYNGSFRRGESSNMKRTRISILAGLFKEEKKKLPTFCYSCKRKGPT